MMQFGLIGIGAGAAAALLFASVTSGVLLSIPLFYLAPLPIMIAGLGWSHWSALTAAITAALALGIAFGPVFFVAFIAVAGLPAWWLGYLAMLARPAANGATTLEWYPPGRLVVWAAILATLLVVAAIPNFGLDADSFRAGLRHTLASILRVETATPADTPLSVPGVSNADRLIDFLVSAVPPSAAVVATLTNVFNLWLAATVVKFSGRLNRPWPPLAAMTFPRPVIAVLAGAIVLSFVGSLVGIVAGVLSAGLLMAYGVLGFAVLHAITRGMASRIFLLAGVYIACWCWAGRCWRSACSASSTRRSICARASPRRAGRRPSPDNGTDNDSPSVQPRSNQGVTTMEVILLERIGKLGQMGDVVRVKDGFARNFLLPRGKALRATADNKQRFESMKAELQAKNLEAKSGAEKLAGTLDGKTVIVLRQASEAGQLFGSVSTRDIAGLLGEEVNRSQVSLNAPIKTIGKYTVPLALHPEVETNITVIVARSAGEAERVARGEDVTVRREQAEEDAAAALEAAEAFFEPEAAKALREESEPKAGAEAQSDKPTATEEAPAKTAKKAKKKEEQA